MALKSGSRLGPYEIAAQIGRGGMGEVYRAIDTNLKRGVAIKVLPESVASNADRVLRFQREAEVLASLNHPNIAAVYGLERTGDTTALVLELVEGPTLADRIARGPIPIDEALPIAKQIAEALEAAHEQGIIHRDLKPANIKVRPDGTVKVLDFGLAKAMDPERSEADIANSPTLTAHATQMGVILGTAAYMAPEQARGKPVDRRADIWAFGAVLFEMLTGKRPFDGRDVSETLAGVLRLEPAWEGLGADVPPRLTTLLRRCLEKEPRQRVQAIGDARLAMDGAFETTAPSSSPGSGEGRTSPPWSRRLPWALAGLAGAVSLFVLLQPRPDVLQSGPVARLELGLPEGAELYTGGPGVGVSPDGSRIAFIANIGGVRSVYVRQLDQFESVPVRNSETASFCCTFSPDGRSLAFISADARLTKVSLSDGLVTTVATNVGILGASWGSNDAIVFVRSGELWQVNSSGGEETQLTRTGPEGAERRAAWPIVLPGAKAVLFASAERDEVAWRIESLVPATGERRIVVEQGTFPQFAPTGHLIFYRDGELLAAPFDAETRRVSGSTVRILEDVPATSSGVPLLAVSAAGVLAYAPIVSTTRLVWVSRDGAEQTVTDTPRDYMNPRLDPGGRGVLVGVGSNLWVHDLERSTFTLLTFTGSYDAYPALAPDGTRVVFRTPSGLSWQATAGGGQTEPIVGTVVQDFPNAISPDGEQVLFTRLSPETAGDMYIATLTGDADVRPLLATPAFEGGAKPSPDGRWLAYSSNDSGRLEVYLRPFQGPDRRWQVSTAGGTQAMWNPDGTEIFYRSESRMMVVSVATGDEPTLSDPVLLFDRPYAYGTGITTANYDVSADGQRFLMVKDESHASRLNIVLNWHQDLKRLVPRN